MTAEFLAYSMARGNDLSTPRPGFAGLRPGDRWGLCAARWREALLAKVAQVRLKDEEAAADDDGDDEET